MMILKPHRIAGTTVADNFFPNSLMGWRSSLATEYRITYLTLFSSVYFAQVDTLFRLSIGGLCAGAKPGKACYRLSIGVHQF